MSLFHSATSWMAADMQEAPLLRSAGVLTIPSAFDGESSAYTAEDGADAESLVTTHFSARASFSARHSIDTAISKNASMARTEADEVAPTGFAAAIEAVRTGRGDACAAPIRILHAVYTSSSSPASCAAIRAPFVNTIVYAVMYERTNLHDTSHHKQALPVPRQMFD